MASSDAERARRSRDRRRGGPPRQLEPCGTPAAAKRHIRAGESLRQSDTVCQACTDAIAKANAAKYQRRKQRELKACDTEGAQS